MQLVNIFDAKTNFSKLVSAVEKGEEDSIIIARAGKPVARLIKFEDRKRPPRIGGAKGRFVAPVDPSAHDEEIASLLMEGSA